MSEKMPALQSEMILGYAGFAVSKAVLGYLIPFVTQLGFGATLGTSAIRGALVGTSGLVSQALVTGTVFLPEEMKLAGVSGAYLIESSIAGGIYAGTQAIFDWRSQGGLYDFTFGTLSTAATTGIAAPLGSLGGSLLKWSRAVKKEGYTAL